MDDIKKTYPASPAKPTNYQTQLEELIEITIQEQASDLHFSYGHYPTLRVDGKLIPLLKKRKMISKDTQGLARALMSEIQYERFLREKEVDFSYNFKDKARFRVSVFVQRGYVSVALRLIPTKVKTIEELNLPLILFQFAKAPQGFVLVTGPSSQGKSTTLAAIIEEINKTRNDHIITIEDPIEYIFQDKKSIIDQRELYQDTLSFARALKSTFRQDPDVIMVGEMRDPETISTAITAAETGHLVLATLHTNSASQTIHRIVDSFPSGQQNQIMAQLSGSILGVVCQRLVPRIRGGLVPACEIMLATPAIRNLIRENKIHELPLVIETSIEKGMISLNRSLASLVKAKEVSLETALSYSPNPAELKMFIG